MLQSAFQARSICTCGFPLFKHPQFLFGDCKSRTAAGEANDQSGKEKNREGVNILPLRTMDGDFRCEIADIL
jgi:hypothetical protein